MAVLKQLAQRLVREEDGQGMVEYGILLALIAAVSIVVVKNVGQHVNGAFQKLDSAMTTNGVSTQGAN